MYGHRKLQKISKIYVLLLFYKVKLCKKWIFCDFRISLISVHLLPQTRLEGPIFIAQLYQDRKIKEVGLNWKGGVARHPHPPSLGHR